MYFFFRTFVIRQKQRVIPQKSSLKEGMPARDTYHTGWCVFDAQGVFLRDGSELISGKIMEGGGNITTLDIECCHYRAKHPDR